MQCVYLSMHVCHGKHAKEKGQVQEPVLWDRTQVLSLDSEHIYPLMHGGGIAMCNY